jgi:hypothetical protein
VCDDFDICQDCEAKNVHPVHPLLKISGESVPSGPSSKSASPLRSLQATFLRHLNLPSGSCVTPGQIVIKEWEIMNPVEGAQWPKGTKLIFERGDRELLEAQEEFPLPELAPGQKTVVSVPLVLRKDFTGRREAHFRLADANRELFGDRCSVKLEITPEVVSSPSVVASAAGAPGVAGAASAEKKEKKDEKEFKGLPSSGAQNSSYQSQLDTLLRMGFISPEINLHILRQFGGNIQQAVACLLEMRTYGEVY